MTHLEYLIGLKDALPFSSEQPCQRASNSEIRRWLKNGTVLFNGEKAEFNEIVDYPLFSVVFFPKSEKRRTTLVWGMGK